MWKRSWNIITPLKKAKDARKNNVAIMTPGFSRPSPWNDSGGLIQHDTVKKKRKPQNQNFSTGGKKTTLGDLSALQALKEKFKNEEW